MQEVERLAFRRRLIRVEDNEFFRDAGTLQGKRRAGPDAAAAADDCDLHFFRFATISSVSFCTRASISAELGAPSFVIGLKGVTGDEQPCEPHICDHGSTSQRPAGLRS